MFLDLTSQHESQIQEMENIIKSAQDLSIKQSMKNKEQVEKLILSENIIEQLAFENENLLFRLQFKNEKNVPT